MSERQTILFVTTADTDLLTADRALAGIPHPGFPHVEAFNPTGLDSPEARDRLLNSAAKAGTVVLRLLGGKRAMPEVFDPLVQLCRSRGVPLIACPGHQEWDEDLVAACSVPAAEVDTVFSYLLCGGAANIRNLFLFLSDTYLGTAYGHDAPGTRTLGRNIPSRLDRRLGPGPIRPTEVLAGATLHWPSLLPGPLDEQQLAGHRRPDTPPGGVGR